MAARFRMMLKNYRVQLPDRMPRLEQWIKQNRHALWVLLQRIRQGKRPPVFYTWPELPSRRAALYKMTRSLGWELTNLPRQKAIAGIRFKDATQQNLSASTWPIDLEAPTVLNTSCIDIRKQTLEKAHANAFGYGMSVDPLMHQGQMVIKSDENAKHDGHLVHGPIDPNDLRSNVVYQLNIDNRDESGRYFDYRIVWILGHIPVIYQKFKAPNERFTNATVETKLVADVALVLSETEREAIARLTHSMHVDYAELDALRDRHTGQLFVVDVNPTPWGPPAGLGRNEMDEAIQKMAQCLQDQVLRLSK